MRSPRRSYRVDGVVIVEVRVTSWLAFSGQTGCVRSSLGGLLVSPSRCRDPRSSSGSLGKRRAAHSKQAGVALLLGESLLHCQDDCAQVQLLDKNFRVQKNAIIQCQEIQSQPARIHTTLYQNAQFQELSDTLMWERLPPSHVAEQDNTLEKVAARSPMTGEGWVTNPTPLATVIDRLARERKT